MIAVEHLTKCYGDFTAVNDLSFEIGAGAVYGFLGPNGAGKSTTMNIMTGYLGATSGTVKINGYDIFTQPEEAKKMYWLSAGAAAPVHGYDRAGIFKLRGRTEKTG